LLRWGSIHEEGDSIRKNSFPYRVYDRKPHRNIVIQVLEDEDLLNIIGEISTQEGRSCSFCERKLKEESLSKEIQ
jgi:hypothetical protein